MRKKSNLIDISKRVSSQYLENYETKTLLSFSEIESRFPFFHISDEELHDKNTGKVTLSPRVPRSFARDDNRNAVEDNFTPRVSLSKNISGALEALKAQSFGRNKLYAVLPSDVSSASLFDVSARFQSCAKAVSSDGNIYPQDNYTLRQFIIDYPEYVNPKKPTIGPSDLNDQGRSLWMGCVPDAKETSEVWALNPVTLIYIGRITRGEIEVSPYI